MLDFEAALARAEAKTGVIPAHAAPAIAAKCRAELFDAHVSGAGCRAGRQPGDPARRPAPGQGRRGRCGGRPLRALGRHQPGRDRHRLHAAATASPRAHRERAHGARECPGAPRPRPPLDTSRGSNVDAAGAAHHVRAEGGGLAVGRRSASRARGRTSTALPRSAVRWGRRDAGRAGPQGHGRGRGPGRGAAARRSGPVLAHPPRPDGGGRHRGGALHGHAREDRARSVPLHADRARRSVRAGGRRARRLVDPAAQEEPGDLRRRPGGGGAACRAS